MPNPQSMSPDEMRGVVLYERALRAELAKTLKTEAPKIKQRTMRDMAKHSALNIVAWDKMQSPADYSTIGNELLDAYQLIYMTGPLARLQYKLGFKKAEAGLYLSAVDIVTAHDLENINNKEHGNPYIYLREADIGFLEAIRKFGYSYLKNQNKVDPTLVSMRAMREDYISQRKFDLSDFFAAIKQRVIGLTKKQDQVEKLKQAEKTAKPEPQPRTQIERSRAQIKKFVTQAEEDAENKLAQALDAVVLGYADENKNAHFSDDMRANYFGNFVRYAIQKLNADRSASGLAFITSNFNKEHTSLLAALPETDPALESARQLKLERFNSLKDRLTMLNGSPASHVKAQAKLRALFVLLADMYVEMYAHKDFYKKRANGKSDADRFVEEHNAMYVRAVMHYHEALHTFAQSRKTDLLVKLSSLEVGKEATTDNNRLAAEISNQLEALVAGTDVILSKKRQEYLQKGFTLAKRFAIGCGFFSAGAWALLIAGVAPWWVAGISLVPCFYFAFHAMRMNWLSSNDEMGDPFFHADVDPGDLRTPMQKRWNTLQVLLGLKGFAAFQALLFKPQSEYSVKGAKRAAQHFANTTTGVVWGLLTAIGLLSLGYSLPAIFYPGLFEWGSAFMVSMGFMGTVNIVAFTALGALGLALGIVTYRVFGLLIRDKSDKDLTQGKELYDNYFKELFLISQINNKTRPTSTHYVKQTATLFGILLTAMSSITLLSDIVAMATGVELGLGFMGINAAIAVSTLLAFSIIVVAFIGLKDFYIQRSQNSVLKGQAATFGGNMGAFDSDKLANIGIDASAPDFAAQVQKVNPNRPWWKSVAEIFFSTADGVNSDRSRRVNALSQAGPAIGGGVAFMLMTVSAGLRALGVISPVAAGVGIAIGVLGGICAAVGSYQANGIGNRTVKHNITDAPLLMAEEAALNKLSLRTRAAVEPANQECFQKADSVAVALKEVINFAASTERKQAAYHGFAFGPDAITNKARVDAARCLVNVYKLKGVVLNADNLATQQLPVNMGGVTYSVAEMKAMSSAILEPGSRLNALYTELNTVNTESSIAAGKLYAKARV